MLVDHVLLPGVEQLDEGEVGLVLLGDWLVDLFVVLYPLKEVCDGLKCTNTKNIKMNNIEKAGTPHICNFQEI